MAKNKRAMPEVSAGSMADIAFLLLIFFLVATTMNVDTGIQRMLPPMPDETQDKPIDINKRNLMLVFVNLYDQINAGGEMIDITQLKDKAKEFVTNPRQDENLPDFDMTEIDGLGTYPVSKGVISLQNDKGTSYNMYIKVQNELTRAFNELRDDLAMQRFGMKFLDLQDTQRDAIVKAIPLKISEAEPRNIEGGN